MAERDPFGRLPDENPLAGLGSLSDGSDGQHAAEPVAARWEAFEETADEPAPRAAARAAAAGEPAPAQAVNIDPAKIAAAPARLARGAAERAKRPVSQVDYVALVGVAPQATWTVVMRGGGQFAGDARGRITRRIG